VKCTFSFGVTVEDISYLRLIFGHTLSKYFPFLSQMQAMLGLHFPHLECTVYRLDSTFLVGLDD